MKRLTLFIIVLISMPLFGAMPSAGKLSNVQMMLSYQKVKIESQKYIPNHILKALTVDDVAALKKYLTQEGGRLDVIDKHGRSMLILAARNSCKNCVQELLARRADVHASDSKGSTAMREAASKGDLGILTNLVKAGGNVKKIDPRGNTLLHWVAYGEASVPVAQYLVDNGVWIHIKNVIGRTASDIARERGEQRLLAYLESESQFLPPDIIDAVSFGDRPMINHYLNANGDVNGVSKTKSRMTLLMFAAFEGHLEIIEDLLKRNADVLLRDTGHRRASDFAKMHCGTPIVVGASRSCYPKIVEALLKAEAQAEANLKANAGKEHNELDRKLGAEPVDASSQEEASRATAAASPTKSISPVISPRDESQAPNIAD